MSGGKNIKSLRNALYLIRKIEMQTSNSFLLFLHLRLATWTDAIDEPVKSLGIVFQPQSAGNSAQYEFIKVYAIILAISFTATFTRSQWIVRGGANCSEIAFEKMLSRVIYAPMSYFETTPVGRILNRLTYDVEVLDITLSISMTLLMASSVSIKKSMQTKLMVSTFWLTGFSTF